MASGETASNDAAPRPTKAPPSRMPIHASNSTASVPASAESSIRGGTDGSILTEMGLPTPNLFSGQHRFHSRLEWVSVQDMELAVRTIVNLARLWEQKG